MLLCLGFETFHGIHSQITSDMSVYTPRILCWLAQTQYAIFAHCSDCKPVRRSQYQGITNQLWTRNMILFIQFLVVSIFGGCICFTIVFTLFAPVLGQAGLVRHQPLHIRQCSAKFGQCGFLSSSIWPIISEVQGNARNSKQIPLNPNYATLSPQLQLMGI